MSSPCDLEEGFPRTKFDLIETVKKYSQKPMQSEEVERIIEVLIDRRLSKLEKELHEKELGRQRETSLERQNIMLEIQDLKASIKFSGKVWMLVVPAIAAFLSSLIVGFILKGVT